jgi:hypothetical protein
MTVPPAAVDAASKGMMIRSVIGHLKENRLEYAVFSLLLYSIGALDKAVTYGTGLCV